MGGDGPWLAISPDRNRWRRAAGECEKPSEVIEMQDLIELYEMASLNDGALDDREMAAILDARHALASFERAMQGFKGACGDASSVVRLAAAA